MKLAFTVTKINIFLHFRKWKHIYDFRHAHQLDITLHNVNKRSAFTENTFTENTLYILLDLLNTVLNIQNTFE